MKAWSSNFSQKNNRFNREQPLMSKMTSSADIREAFLRFFESADHKRVASSSLVPSNDPTLLFTNAGMVQFKDVFLGEDKRSYLRATSSQRCVRAGGKHNDLENVGYTARHHTFFEMLGNFSFGDYFKTEAIPYAWKFLTQTLSIPADKLWVTIYAEDDEAFAIWHNTVGLDKERIIRIGDNKGARYASDNFWSMGDTGPCGPCTEIFYDHGADIEGGLPGTPEEDGDRYIEIWNIVFMQFNRQADGTMDALPKPSVDTGMGLERVAAVMQGVHNNYEIDLFAQLLDAASTVLKIKNSGQSSLRVIADHIRSCAFLIVDGVLPSNEGRGYVLRRIIRRAVRHGHKLGASEPFFWRLVGALGQVMGEAYPELIAQRSAIESALKAEEQQFALTLEQGMKILERDLAETAGDIISGETAFKLYDTYGFPLDLTADIARERGMSVDQAGYEKSMQQQREQAKAASQFKVEAAQRIDIKAKTVFEGYEATTSKSAIADIYVGGEAVDSLASMTDAVIILDASPYYGESGGQVGDTGTLQTNSAVFKVTDTQKQGDALLHIGRLQSGSLQRGESVEAIVNDSARQAIALNHSATHLLHAALKQVLGTHVQQKGSLVDAQRLRFDFSHNQPMSTEELQAVVDLVNQQIRDNSAVETQITDMDSAMQAGATALFGEKYGDSVRVLSMGQDNFSVELCGGTHVTRTGDIGLLRIVSETGIAAGVRRIEGLTGSNALEDIAGVDQSIRRAANLLKAKPQELDSKLQQLLDQQKMLEKKLEQLQQKLASAAGSDLAGSAVDAKGAKVLVAHLPDTDANALRSTVDQLKQKLGDCVIVLAANSGEKIALVAGVSDSLTAKVKAGDMIKNLSAAVDGKGGGRPNFAQGGGSNLAALESALSDTQKTIIDLL